MIVITLFNNRYFLKKVMSSLIKNIKIMHKVAFLKFKSAKKISVTKILLSI